MPTAFVISLALALAACGGGGNGSAGTAPPPVNNTPIPAIPMNLQASAGNAQVGLSWSASASSTSYVIARSASRAGSFTKIATATATSYMDTGLTNGTAYYYVVAASDARGTSANSASVSATPTAPAAPIPATPAGLSAAPSSGSVQLSWTAVTGATSYDVERATATNGPYVPLTTVIVPSFTDTDLNNGTTYFYEVSATNSSGSSAVSAAVTATPLPAEPYTTGTVAVSKPATPGTTLGPGFAGLSYEKGEMRPYISQGSSAWTLSATDASLVAYMKLIGPSILRIGGNSVDKSPFNPLDLTATTTTDRVTLSWAASPGATGYMISRTPAPVPGTSVDGGYTMLASVTTLGYTDQSATVNTAYDYEVTPIGGTNPNIYSSKVSASPGAPPAPSGIAAQAGVNQVIVAWPIVPGAVVSSYRLSRGSSSGSEVPLADDLTSASGSVTYTDTAVTNGDTYYYVVQAVNSAGVSGKSNEVSATPATTATGGTPVVSAPNLTNIHPADIGNLASLMNATGWKVIYGMDFRDNQPIPSRMGDEAAYASEALGANLYGFELGNEPDLYYKNFVGGGQYTIDQFLAQWIAFDNAIIGQVPEAVLTGPATCCEWSGSSSWPAAFAAAEKGRFALLTGHYYSGNAKTMSGLLSPDPSLTGHLQDLAGLTTANDVPNGFRFAEGNTFANGGVAEVSNAFGSALWVMDYLFTNAQYGSQGVNLTGGGNGLGGGSGYYTPIVDNEQGQATGVRPEYYGVYLFSQAARGSLLTTTTNLQTSLNLSAYAVAATAGGSNVILNNKDAATSAVLTISLPQSAHRATVTVLNDSAGLADTSSTAIAINGAQIQAESTWAPPAPVSVPVNPDGSITFTVAPASIAVLWIF